MVWGTDFETNIFISRQLFHSKAEVIDKIDDINKDIAYCESKLKMYAAATPKDIINNDDGIIDQIDHDISDHLDWYRELVVERYKLDLYLYYLNENNIDVIKLEDE